MTSTPTRHVDNVVITTKDLQDRNINILDGTTVENKGKLILTRIEQTFVLYPNKYGGGILKIITIIRYYMWFFNKFLFFI